MSTSEHEGAYIKYVTEMGDEEKVRRWRLFS